MATKKELADSILIEVYGGIPSDDAAMRVAMVVDQINYATAQVVKENFFDNSNVDGVNYANGEFTSIFNVTLNDKDDTGFRYFTLPEMPVGLPKSRGISFVGAKRGSREDFKRIHPHALSSYLDVGIIPNTIVYWVDGNKVSCEALDPTVSWPANLMVKMIAPTGSALTEEMSLPTDAAARVREIVVLKLRTALAMGRDTLNDNLDIKDVR